MPGTVEHKAARRQPERTCIGCGGKAPPGSLVRLVVREGQVKVAEAGAPGRGAWMHPAEACLERATKRGAFARAFRAKVAAEAAAIRVGLTGSARKD